MLLALHVQPSQSCGAGHQAEDAQWRVHLQWLRSIGSIHVADQRFGQAQISPSLLVVHGLPRQRRQFRRRQVQCDPQPLSCPLDRAQARPVSIVDGTGEYRLEKLLAHLLQRLFGGLHQTPPLYGRSQHRVLQLGMPGQEVIGVEDEPAPRTPPGGRVQHRHVKGARLLVLADFKFNVAVHRASPPGPVPKAPGHERSAHRWVLQPTCNSRGESMVEAEVLSNCRPARLPSRRLGRSPRKKLQGPCYKRGGRTVPEWLIWPNCETNLHATVLQLRSSRARPQFELQG